MKSKFKRLVALMVACLLLFASITLVGCNKTASEEPDTEKQTDASEPEAEKESETKESTEPEVVDPFGKYEETLTITTIAGRNSDGGGFEDYKDPDETYENNRWVQLIKEELNIQIEYTAVVDSAQLEQKRKILIASGSIPDFFTSNDVEISQLNKADAIQPVEEVFTKYASETVSELYALGGESIWVPTTLKGQKMAIPNVGSGEAMNQASMLWIRRDWLNNLGLEAPTTLEDVLSAARAFSDSDPDQNGKDDTYGIGLTSDFSSTRPFVAGLFNSYGAYPNIWLKNESGELYNGLLDPKVKEALQGMSELYSEGVLDTEFAIKDTPKLKEDITAGKVGMVFGFHAIALQLGFNNLKENDPDTDFIAMTLPGITQIPADNPGAVVISKDFEHPEAIVKIMNLGAEMYYHSNEEDRTYYIQNEYGLPGLTLFPAPQPLVVGKNPKNSILINEALESDEDPLTVYENSDTLVPKGDFESVYANVKGYIDTQDTAKYPWYVLFGPEGSELVLDKIATENLYIQNMFMGPPTETMVKKEESLNKLKDEAFVRIIMGEDSIDKYDELVENWKELGGDQITTEVNNWVKENQ